MAYQSSGTVIIDNSTNVYGSGVGATSYFSIPYGTTAGRSGSPVVGESRYNTSTNSFEVYDGSGWVYVPTTVA